MKRRNFLTASAAAAAAALAGCGTDGGGNGQSTNDGAENDARAPKEDPGQNESSPVPEDDGTEPEDSGTSETETDGDSSERRNSSPEPDVDFVSHAMVEDDYGAAFVGGDIENTGDAATGYIEVVAYFYDEAGDPIPGDAGIGNHYAFDDEIDAGERLIFEIVTWIDYADVAEYDLEIWVP